METAEQVYKGVTTSQKKQNWVDANRTIYSSTNKGGWSAFSYNPKKGRASRRNKKHAYRASNASTGSETYPDILVKDVK